MNGWALATDLAIWTLIAGSAVVFIWFLADVMRRPGKPPNDHDPADPQESSSRSNSIDLR